MAKNKVSWNQVGTIKGFATKTPTCISNTGYIYERTDGKMDRRYKTDLWDSNGVHIIHYFSSAEGARCYARGTLLHGRTTFAAW